MIPAANSDYNSNRVMPSGKYLVFSLKKRTAGETITAEELPMPQNGWLDYACGVWHLVLESDDHPVQYWYDRDTALAELAGEGWLLLGPFPRRYR